MTRIAPRSSTIAKVSRKARRLPGSDGATTARIASAKAMSVAIGMAQPRGSPSGAAKLITR
jgi:hypothetical protein